MTVRLTIKTSDDVYYNNNDVLSFRFDKDIYTPYTTLTARIRLPYYINNASEVLLSVNGFTVHHGLLDSIKQEQKGGFRFITLSSRGFTSLLCQNQIEPGLKMNISFNMLMEDFYTLPYVSHENDPDDSSYLYIIPNTSMWDAAVNLTYKRRGTYPYIRSANTVMMSPVAAPVTFDLSNERFISLGTEHINSRLASDYHMADINGDYGTFDLHDSDAAALKIVRHKYFDLDMRFLYDPQQALVYRDKYDFRGRERVYCSYSGYHGEDLCDIISFGNISSERIGFVTIRGSSRGIFTETGVYRDKFPHT